MQVLFGKSELNVFRGTITGLRISAVDDTAFIDNAGATIPTFADGNHLIEIYDSSNRMIKGVLKAAGSAETLDSELLINGNFSSDVGWAQGTSGWLIAGDILTAITSVGNVYRPGNDIASTNNALYKLNMDVVRTGGSVGFGLRNIFDDTQEFSSNGNKSSYVVSNGAATTIVIRTVSSFSGTIDNASVKQVLAPSTSGCTVVNAKGGTTYRFSYKDASFTYNAASYFCIVKKLR